jgi:hypothetical protein
MRVRTAQKPQFARRATRNGEGIRESCPAVFGPAHFDDPTGFKGYFCKTGLKVSIFGSDRGSSMIAPTVLARFKGEAFREGTVLILRPEDPAWQTPYSPMLY